MFQFPGFAHLAVYHAFSMVGCPIRTSVDQFLFADPHSFSQLITSFFASESLGILHALLLTSSTYVLVHQIHLTAPPMILLLLLFHHVNELLARLQP